MSNYEDMIEGYELQELRAYVSNAGMPDRCVFLRWSADEEDEAGKPINLYTPDQNSIVCRFHAIPEGAQTETEDAEVVTADAILHVPLGTSFETRDRIRLLERWDIPINPPQDYQILGLFSPNALDTGIHVKLITNRLD